MLLFISSYPIHPFPKHFYQFNGKGVSCAGHLRFWGLSFSAVATKSRKSGGKGGIAYSLMFLYIVKNSAGVFINSLVG